MGEHDSLPSRRSPPLGLERVHARRGNPGLLAITGLVIGVVGTILGAALASLIGIYLASVVVLLLARRRGDLRWTAAPTRAVPVA